eukprot:TRINITY_DN82198_c0_g1_i1.p1 TRINITY_DN82198_c0_g1~~TRINITY_DN82198_c0_g1_i1.p1  ORF type:complete len:204 (-),score=33.81 TRINITY_DN82198_c0_g1_i1:69-680(-)
MTTLPTREVFLSWLSEMGEEISPTASLYDITVDLYTLYIEVVRLGGIDQAILSSVLPTVLRILRVPLKMQSDLIGLYVDRLYLLELQRLWKGTKHPNMSTVFLYTKNRSLWGSRSDVPSAASMTFSAPRVRSGPSLSSPTRLQSLSSIPVSHETMQKDSDIGAKEPSADQNLSSEEMEQQYQALHVSVLAASLSYYDETHPHE